MENEEQLKEIARYVRYLILISTTEAGSGHPTSSLSATDLMVGLLFGGTFRFDADRPDHPNNDRVVFSKGHASPLLYALWAAAGKVTQDEMMALRKFGSPLEGHPTYYFPFAEAATGSLGHGLSIGAGMALNGKYLDKLQYRTYILLGDSEMSEGSQWEAIQLAAHYRLDNLVGILDVNRLGQRGETMYGHDLAAYERRISVFGWETVSIDGHNFAEIQNAYKKVLGIRKNPIMILARTIKGKGVSSLEDQNGLHGKPVKREDLAAAILDLGKIDYSVRGTMDKPMDMKSHETKPQTNRASPADTEDGPVPTRKAYGRALTRIYSKFPHMVVLDAEMSNSTYAEVFQQAHPSRFFEMYIAEQNMVGMALGLSRHGKIPFVSTFAAFLTRATDQIRMSQYSLANIKFCGSHAGVSIGEDGPSQMGLEDIALFRTIFNSVVLYPADAISTEKLVEEAAGHTGIVYIRTTRNPTPILYESQEKFPVGGCKVLREDVEDDVAVIAAGITLHESLQAYEQLRREGVSIRVIDLYSIKPIDRTLLMRAIEGTKAIVTVEDHVAEGGLGEAVRSVLPAERIPIHSLAVRDMPRSGPPETLLDFEGISKRAIVKQVKSLM